MLYIHNNFKFAENWFSLSISFLPYDHWNTLLVICTSRLRTFARIFNTWSRPTATTIFIGSISTCFFARTVSICVRTTVMNSCIVDITLRKYEYKKLRIKTLNYYVTLNTACYCQKTYRALRCIGVVLQSCLLICIWTPGVDTVRNCISATFSISSTTLTVTIRIAEVGVRLSAAFISNRTL